MDCQKISLLLFVTISLSSCVWSSLALNISPWRSFNPIWLSFLFFMMLNNENSSFVIRGTFRNVVIMTMCTLYFSVITSFMLYGQPVIYSIFNITQLTYGFFLYFVLHKYNVSIEIVIKNITIFSVVWVFLEIGQQFTYPTIWFSGRPDTEMRMGIYRFYIWGVDFVMIAMCYWWGVLMKNFSIDNKKLMILCLILFSGLMCYCSRKHIYATLFVVALSILSMKGKHKLLGKFFIISILFFLYYSFANDFSQMNDNLIEVQGGEGEDFIRFLAFKYFTTEFFTNPIEYIFGIGLPELTTSVGQELMRLREMYGFYQADIGIFGYFTQFGIMGEIPILLYLFIFLRNWKYIDWQYRYFFLMKLILIVFDFWAMWGVGMLAWALFMYIVDKNINENKKLFAVNENRSLNLF